MSAPLPRPAATLALLRDAGSGLEVLMMQRAQSAVFLGGAYVFPGGALDAADSDARVSSRVLGLTDEDASRRLNLPSGGLAYYIAAVRECFEEAGILLLSDKNHKPISPSRANSLLRFRQKNFIELLEAEELYIPGDALAYCGHWITAPGRARRFDTRFFAAIAPEGQQGSHDAAETVHDVWISPRAALERSERGEIELVFATQTTLRDLGRFATARAAFEHVQGIAEIETNRACWAQGKEGPKIFRRADAPYFEIHWSDAEESGQTTYDLVPGVPKRLDRWVTRLIAPNPGMMTGPGTNTYLVGEQELAVIDPGPDIGSHVEKILHEGKEKIRWILCTHTHMDHSPAAAALKAATGAQILGRPAPQGQDESFRPDLVLENGQRVDLGALSLRAIHTPGHASNHLCYFLESTRMLFTGDQVMQGSTVVINPPDGDMRSTGDQVMQGSTVVINPPDGDMRAYLRSLEKLLAEDIAIIAPGHGYLIGAPQKELRRLIAHRLAREQKVLSALRALEPASLEDLLPLVYDDVPARIHRVAARSLTAHLEKLAADGAVRHDGGRYALLKSGP